MARQALNASCAKAEISAYPYLPSSTRVLQNVCSHSKASQDLRLTSQVPGLKRSMEQLVFRAKAMLAANNCASAFSIGTLKHKNIDGQAVSSQVPRRNERYACYCTTIHFVLTRVHLPLVHAVTSTVRAR